MDRINFSHHVPRRLPAEVVYDAVILATGSDQHASKLRDELDEMAIADGKPRRRNQSDFALEVFGQSVRESNCDCDRSNSPSLLQSIYLRNDADMHKRLGGQGRLGRSGLQGAWRRGARIGRESSTRRELQRRVDAVKKQFVARIDSSTNSLRIGRKRCDLNSIASTNESLRNSGSSVTTRPNSTNWSMMSIRGTGRRKARKPNRQRRPSKSLVEDAYLRTLSRYPDDDEAEIAVSFIQESEVAR